MALKGAGPMWEVSRKRMVVFCEWKDGLFGFEREGGSRKKKCSALIVCCVLQEGSAPFI